MFLGASEKETLKAAAADGTRRINTRPDDNNTAFPSSAFSFPTPLVAAP